MANKRMFSKQITTSDAFVDMPISSQLLYFHLNMEADDDGFVSNPKRITKIIGANDDDLKILLAKRFLLSFQTGVVVIKHWLLHNAVRKDMYKETQYLDEKKALKIKDNGVYTEVRNESVTEPLHRIDQDRLDKDSINTPTEDGVDIQKMLEEGQMQQFQDMGLQIFEKTGAPKNKKGECFRLAKQYPQLIQPALRFSLDYPNQSLKWKMFLWKLNQLIKNEVPK